MSKRMSLPNRRPGTTLTIKHGPPGREQSYFVTIGQGQIGGDPVEVFVQAEQTSSAVEAVARDAAILVSFALQFGIAASLLRDGMTREENGSPSSVIGAILDAMLREFPPRSPDEPTPAPTPAPSGPSDSPAPAAVAVV